MSPSLCYCNVSHRVMLSFYLPTLLVKCKQFIFIIQKAPDCDSSTTDIRSSATGARPGAQAAAQEQDDVVHIFMFVAFLTRLRVTHPQCHVI